MTWLTSSPKMSQWRYFVKSSLETLPNYPAQNMFVFITKSVGLQHNKCVCLLVGSWFRNPKKHKLGKNFPQNYILRKDGPEKGTETFKQDMRWKSAKHLPSSAVYILGRCRVVFLHSFISCLVSVIFQVHPYLKWCLAELFPLAEQGFACD